MKLLEDKIRREGKILHGSVLKVSSFLNHQMDPELIMELGAEMAVLLQNGDGDWKECRRLKYYGLKTARIPIRAEMADYYRIGIAGTGKCVIHGIERRTAKGGRSWSVHI